MGWARKHTSEISNLAESIICKKRKEEEEDRRWGRGEREREKLLKLCNHLVMINNIKLEIPQGMREQCIPLIFILSL